MKRIQSNKGFSLVEMAIVIGVISFLIISISAGSGMIDNSKIQSASKSAREISTAAQSWLSLGKSTYTGVSVTALKTDELLPGGFNETGSNPWGGNFSVGANSSNSSYVDVALTAVPANAATKMQALFANQARAVVYDSGSKVWTATF